MFHLISFACFPKGRSLNPDVKEKKKKTLRIPFWLKDCNYFSVVADNCRNDLALCNLELERCSSAQKSLLSLQLPSVAKGL